MDVIPGNVEHAGIADVIRRFRRRNDRRRFAYLIRQTIEDAAARRPETARSALMMQRSGEGREPRASRRKARTARSKPCTAKPCAARGSRIGKCRVRAK